LAATVENSACVWVEYVRVIEPEKGGIQRGLTQKEVIREKFSGLHETVKTKSKVGGSGLPVRKPQIPCTRSQDASQGIKEKGGDDRVLTIRDVPVGRILETQPRGPTDRCPGVGQSGRIDSRQ